MRMGSLLKYESVPEGLALRSKCVDKKEENSQGERNRGVRMVLAGEKEDRNFWHRQIVSSCCRPFGTTWKREKKRL